MRHTKIYPTTEEEHTPVTLQPGDWAEFILKDGKRQVVRAIDK